jgi:hypothetical protein
MNEQGRNQQSPTQLTLLYKELKKQPHRETQRERDTHTQDDKDARQEELERAWDWRHKTAKGTSFRAQQELEVEGIWGIERKGNGKGER